MATARKTYNGHPSRNFWNVSLWINNDEALYRLALECIRETKTRRDAAWSMMDELNARMALAVVGAPRGMGNAISTTPDGAPYTIASIMRAMRGMER